MQGPKPTGAQSPFYFICFWCSDEMMRGFSATTAVTASATWKPGQLSYAAWATRKKPLVSGLQAPYLNHSGSFKLNPENRSNPSGGGLLLFRCILKYADSGLSENQPTGEIWLERLYVGLGGEPLIIVNLSIRCIRSTWNEITSMDRNVFITIQ